MFDRFDILAAFSLLMVLYIIWIDVRPFVRSRWAAAARFQRGNGDTLLRGRDMTFRERIADWISGGRISFWRRESNDGWLKAIERADALRRIAACETPNANATVKRMARIAREGLE